MTFRQRLRQERQEINDQVRAILLTARGEARDNVSPEDRKTADELFDKRDKLDKQLSTHERRVASVALVRGRWDGAEDERRALGNPTASGAGMQTLPIEGDNAKFARITQDPTFSFKAENDSFTATEPTGDVMTFAPKTIGAVVVISRELAEDAPNANNEE